MKGDKTTLLALLAAAVILGAVGIKSYFDYKLALEDRKTLAAAPAPEAPAPATPENPPAPVAQEETPTQEQIDALPRSVLPPIPPQLLTETTPSPPASPATPAGGAKGGQPESRPGSIEAETLRKETDLYEETLNRLRNGQTSGAPRPASPSSAVQATESPIPGPDTSAVAAATPLTGPAPTSPPERAVPVDPAFGPAGTPPTATDPGAAPISPQQTEAEVAALAEQIRRQPAIAQVVEYDNDFAFLIINGGTDRNIKTDMRLAVRRGSEILGFIKVVEVDPTESVAELMSQNKHSPTARKPQAGDDVIAFNLF